MKAIETRYIGPSARRESRVKAKAEGGHSVTLAWDDGLDSDQNHAAAATALCKKLDWHGELVMGGSAKGRVFVFVTHRSLPNSKDYPQERITV